MCSTHGWSFPRLVLLPFESGVNLASSCCSCARLASHVGCAVASRYISDYAGNYAGNYASDYVPSQGQASGKSSPVSFVASEPKNSDSSATDHQGAAGNYQKLGWASFLLAFVFLKSSLDDKRDRCRSTSTGKSQHQ